MNRWRSQASHEVLRLRSQTLRTIREFLYDKGYIEVETPKISQFATVDRHIENITVQANADTSSFLVTSPEYHMKRLLASGSGHIFQLGRVFRKGELGDRHNVEFTMLEWYKVHCDEKEFMDEVELLLQHLLTTDQNFPRTTYQETLRRHTGIDPFAFTKKDFMAFCHSREHDPGDSLLQSNNTDDFLDYLMGFFVEPRLGARIPEFITHYPASQASLARLSDDGRTARRFEVYYRGVELCNGFDELRDARQQRERFAIENEFRRQARLPTHSVDKYFMDALNAGLPECCGAALGVDRLLMALAGKNTLREVIAFPFDCA